MEKHHEELNKSIDALLDELFKGPKPEKIEIAEKKVSNETPMEAKKPAMTSDEGLEGVDAGEEESDGENGRPKDPSNMSHRDADGASHLDYDSSITSPAKKVPNETTNSPALKKSFQVSEEDYELLRKAKAAQQAEALRKVRDEQTNLIKSAVQEAISPLKAENEALRKSISEQEALLKSMAKKPRQQKSISTVAVLEKSFAGNDESAPRQEAFSKSEMLDAAERLMKSKVFSLNDVIELDDTGYIYDAGKRRALEEELRRQK